MYVPTYMGSNWLQDVLEYAPECYATCSLYEIQSSIAVYVF